MRHKQAVEPVPSRAGAILMAAVCGAAVGVALGLLFAPKRGVKLRKDILDSANRIRQQASDGYDEAVEAIGELAEHAAKSAARATRANGRTARA